MEAFHHHIGIISNYLHRPAQIIADDARMMVKGLRVWHRILTRNDGDINLIRYVLTYFILINYLVEDYEIY